MELFPCLDLANRARDGWQGQPDRPLFVVVLAGVARRGEDLGSVAATELEQSQSKKKAKTYKKKPREKGFIISTVDQLEILGKPSVEEPMDLDPDLQERVKRAKVGEEGVRNFDMESSEAGLSEQLYEAQ